MANKLDTASSAPGWFRWTSRILLIVSIPLPLLPPWTSEWGAYPYFAGLVPIGNSFILLIIAIVAWIFPRVGGAIGSFVVILEYLTFYPANFPGNFPSDKLIISLLLPIILAFGAALSVKAGQKSNRKTVEQYARFQWPLMILMAVPPIVILMSMASYFGNNGCGWSAYFGFPFLFSAIVIWITPLIGGIISIFFSILIFLTIFIIPYFPLAIGVPFLLIGGLFSLLMGMRIRIETRKDENAKEQTDQSA